MSSTTQIACRLDEPGLGARLAELRSGLLAHMLSVAIRENGCTLEFPLSDDRIDEALDFVRFERRCCPFLSFTLDVPAEGPSFSLQIEGPDGSGDLMRATFLPPSHPEATTS